MPTPCPKPAPRTMNRDAACAGAAARAAVRAARRAVIRCIGLADGETRHVSDRRASDVFVECLEAEGVKYVFGIPGEETLDLNESLAASSVAFVPVRHEQGGAYMADMYGRLTGRAGVC